MNLRHDLRVLDELDAEWMSGLPEVVGWFRAAFKDYFSSGCRRESLVRHVDELLPIMKGWLDELAEVEHEGAATRQREIAIIGADPDDADVIDKHEHNAVAAARLAQRLIWSSATKLGGR